MPRLTGIICPLITPLKGRDTLDKPALKKLIDRVLAARPAGLFLLGTTGEGPALGTRVQMETIAAAAEHTGGRAPLLIGVTESSHAESLELVRAAERAGCQAVVHAGLCYSPVSQTNLREYFVRFAAESALPVYLYNMPSATGIRFEPATVAALAATPNIAGYTDSSGDLMGLQQVCRLLAERGDFSIFVGPEELLLPALLAGADGGVNGGANIFPALYVRLHDAFRAGNLAEAQRLQEFILEVSVSLYGDGTREDYLRRMKAALSVQGIGNGLPAEPYDFAPEEELEEVDATLKRLTLAYAKI